jgi:hypothetical protein
MAIWRQIGQRSNLAMCLGDSALVAYELGDFDTALAYAQEGIAITEELNHADLASYNYYALGAAACGLNDLTTSRSYFVRSLQTARKAQLNDNLCAALYYLAQLLVKESQVPTLSPAQRLTKEVQALELLAFILHHRATWQLFRDRALRVQAPLLDRLPAHIATSAIERAQQRTLDEVVAEILSNEPQPSAPAIST